jgi:hypothetical protein
LLDLAPVARRTRTVAGRGSVAPAWHRVKPSTLRTAGQGGVRLQPLRLDPVDRRDRRALSA